MPSFIFALFVYTSKRTLSCPKDRKVCLPPKDWLSVNGKGLMTREKNIPLLCRPRQQLQQWSERQEQSGCSVQGPRVKKRLLVHIAGVSDGIVPDAMINFLDTYERKLHKRQYRCSFYQQFLREAPKEEERLRQQECNWKEGGGKEGIKVPLHDLFTKQQIWEILTVICQRLPILFETLNQWP